MRLWEHGGSEFENQLRHYYRTYTDTEIDQLGWRELCGKLVQAAKLVEEDVRVDIATRDAAQVNVIINDWYDYDDEREVAPNENDPDNENVIDKIVILCFYRFL